MVETLEYATPERRSMNQRRIGWTACIISILISLWMGLGSVVSAYQYRRIVSGIAGRDAEGFQIDKFMNQVVPPVLLCISLIGCGMCWRRKTGGWSAYAALLIGVGGWVISLLIYP